MGKRKMTDKEEKFDLSKRIFGWEMFSVLEIKDIKEFINLIEVKVLMDWKGQNEFVDWLKKKSGEELNR
jgi:hypothetical protein